MSGNDKEHGEIIIVRRGHGDHDDHHGGVWKIAFADFMTAMMAFFLVMWLINAANEQTKKAVASYFNPVKLMDTTTNPRGVMNPKYGEASDNSEENDPDKTTISSSKSQNQAPSMGFEEAYEEQAIFVDPYALLSEVAGGVTNDVSEENISLAEEKNSGSGSSLVGGESFQDPFDPSAWNLQFGQSSIDRQTLKADGLKLDQQEELAEAAAEDTQSEMEESVAAQSERGVGEESESASERPLETASDAGLSSMKVQQLQSLADRLGDELSEGSPVPFSVEILPSEGAVKVSFMEDSESILYEIGSAKPSPSLVAAIDRIGPMLATEGGEVSVAGHTDGRPFKSEAYDNWRLSTARAHMAYHMLIRAGLPEERIVRIEGHADRELMNKADPLAHENRRIEILWRRNS